MVLKKEMVGKNSQLHVMIETNFKEKLKKEAKEKSISISELCRQKLREDTQLDRIDRKIDGVLEKRKIN